MSKISEKNDNIYKLKSRVAIQEETINNLLTECDDNEQYSRRSCLRIYGMESNSNEKNEDVIEKIREFYNESELPCNEDVIDHTHGVGKEYTDSISKKKVKSVIRKFRSWKARQQLYNAPPRVQKDGKKNFRISIDLTRRRHQLLSEARRIEKDINATNFTFVNINYSLGVRYENGSFDYFSSKQELHNIIDKFD